MSLPSASPSIDLPVPFEMIETLHTGSERSVYRVRDRAGRRTSVLKIVNPGAGQEVVRAIEQEFLLLERIAHPHLVRVSRFLHLRDGSRGFLMEDLEAEVARGPDAPGWAPRDPEAVRSILGALRCLHAIGYAHLDLKPSQVLRGPRGAALIDLGLAAPISSRLAPRGTWGFIAPELLAGGEWDRRVDIYELGCLLVAVWTGETPLGGGEIAEQIRRQMKRPRLRLREHVPGIPEGLDRVVEALLDPDPAQRPADAQKAWESLHTMAGARERYLERRNLPLPDAMPLIASEEIEAQWDRSLREGGPLSWTVEGPIGSGRHRMLRRLRARAEVLGAECVMEGDRLDVSLATKDGSKAIKAVCRVGSTRAGEKAVALGAVGAEQAKAALEAYGLPAEGGEEGWTAALLQARLDERVGGEESRRRSGRIRRSLAAALGARVPAADCERLAEAIVAVSPEERPAPIPSDPLVREGWVREGAGGGLTPATPPWDRDALRALVDEEEIEAAHRRLLGRSGVEAVARAHHALGARDMDATKSSLAAAVDALKQRGDVAGASGILARGRALLGPAFPAEWLALHAALALEDGAPTRCFRLLDARGSEVPREWKILLRAHLDNRAGRRQEAIDAAKPLLDRGRAEALRRAAAAIVVRALVARGDLAEATGLGLPLLAESGAGVPAPEKLRLAALLFNALTLQGTCADECGEVRRILEEGLDGSGLRERFMSAGSLGHDAFRRGEFEKARGLLEMAHESAIESGDPMQIAAARTSLGGVYFEAGRLADSEDLNRLALAAYEEMQERVHAAVTRCNLAAVFHLAGRWGESLDLSRASRGELEAMGAQDEADSALGFEACLLLDLGLLDAGTQALDLCAERLSRLPQPIVEAIHYRARGRIERMRGGCDEARRHWGLSIEIAAGADAADEEKRTLQEWTAAEISWGNLAAAAELRDRTTREAGTLGTGDLRVRREFLDAAFDIQCKGAAGAAPARQRLMQAATMAARSGLRPWVWRCHAAQAGVAAQAGDDAAARAATRLALDGLRDLLDAIGTPALQESFVLQPDPRLFLLWCEHEAATRADLAPGSSDLEVFLR